MNLARQMLVRTLLVAALSAPASPAFAQAQPEPIPERQIPPMVLAELRAMQNRFETALYADCAPERCFAKGCIYGDHSVTDRPPSTALPGLGEQAGPGSVPAQEYLTLAKCSFAYERSLGTRNAKLLVRRLRTKLSGGWTRVEVSAQRLEPIPEELRLSPEPPAPPKEEEPEPEPAPPPVPDEWELPVALRELWTTLLPHFAWMIALVMGTFAAILLIWAWRRLGRTSPEEAALMAQLAQKNENEEVPEAEPAGEDSELPDVRATSIETADLEFVEEQRTYWRERLLPQDPPDPDVRALIALWLRTGEMGMLAKAVLTFPEALPKAFPDGGEYAEAKLHFSEYLRGVSQDTLPSDEAFYTQLRKHALSASLERQADAQGMATLRAGFGAAGLVRVIKSLPARFGGLLFAHASTGDQLESARLMSPTQVADLAEQLLLSNRMSAMEADYLLSLLSGAQTEQPLPLPPTSAEVSDLGSNFDAASALSILLPVTDPSDQRRLLANAKQRFGGVFPSWYKDILWPDVLMKLNEEDRADLFYEVDVKNLAGWLSILPAAKAEGLLAGLSSTLRTAIRASSEFPDRRDQLEKAQLGRKAIAASLHRYLGRVSVPFESLVV